MKKPFTLLLVFIIGLCSVSNAQTALDPDQLVNPQITGPGVYTVEAGKFYAFDGRIDLTFEITIQGPDEGWIMNATNPPVLVNTPSLDGDPRDFFELKAGGAITLKNVLFSGTHNNGEIGKVIVNNTAGSKMIIDNCVITDWQDFAFRNQVKGDSVSVTNCVFVNGMRPRFSQWGGFPVRLDVAADDVIFENNTVVNSGRLLCNSGPFHNANVHQIHNTYLNQAVAGEEQRANEFITANNIFYNFHILGRKTESHSNPDNAYGAYFTTWNYYADSKDKLDSISLYLGQNLFFRPQKVLDWWDTSSGDSLAVSYLWEKPDVDSFIIDDNNYTIGTNYAELDPGFTTPPDNLDSIVGYIDRHYNRVSDDWIDWRIPSPVSFDEATGAPSLSWPPAIDLTYSNSFLQSAGTDSLPLGDLNWFPDKKAEYLAEKDDILAALRDSMVNAVAVYDPLTMDETPLITEAPITSTEQVDPSKLYLSGNYPNPFNEITTIKFGLDQQSEVTLRVFNLLGQLAFESNEFDLPQGTHEINFNASNLTSGIYLYKINAVGSDGKHYVATKKMILSR